MKDSRFLGLKVLILIISVRFPAVDMYIAQVTYVEKPHLKIIIFQSYLKGTVVNRALPSLHGGLYLKLRYKSTVIKFLV